MYGDVVMGVQKRAGEDHEPFESVIEHLKDERYGKHDFPDVKLTVIDLKELVKRFKALINERAGKSFPQDAEETTLGRDWRRVRLMDERPRDCLSPQIRYSARLGHGGQRPDDGLRKHGRHERDRSRFHARSGQRRKSFLRRISDQRAGRRCRRRRAHAASDCRSGQGNARGAQRADDRSATNSKQHFKDMQDLEFTVEDKRLYILQTRNGKRTGHAAVRIAVDMVDEKLISKKDAVRRIPADSLAHLLAPIFDRQSAREAKKIGSGLAAGPGAASGHVVFSAKEAVARSAKGEKVVLARIETSPEDLRGMIAAEGILTSRGGVSSHAALVARQMGKVCVCGASGIQIDYKTRTLSANGTTLKQGDYDLDRRNRGRSFRRRSHDRALGDRAGSDRSFARWKRKPDLSANTPS